MKAAFVVLRAAYLVAVVAWALGAGWAKWMGIVLAVATLWYLVPGTVINLAVLVLALLAGTTRVAIMLTSGRQRLNLGR